MKKLVLLAFLFSISATSFLSAQAKQTQKEIFQPVYNTSKSIVQSQNYQFVANVIHNSGEREMLNGDANQIRINKLEVSGQLHGFSKDRMVYTLKDSNSKNSTVFNDEKQQISIVIKTADYDITIEVKPNGKAFLTLTRNGSSNLSYIGELVKL